MSKTLPETIRDAIEQHGLLPAGAKVVAAVSGGADSVALLRAMCQLEIPCTVAHLNHGLRGAEADTDERFVVELSEALNLPVVVKHADVRKLAEASGMSVEMAARQARHDFFKEFNDAVIVLAHHADDQVETFFLKLARGAGTEGLGGMAYAQPLGPIRLIRPMLGVSRAEIVQWLKTNGYDWREDASNTDETILRNRVRHTILPMLERELNPNMRDTILRTMDILQAENDYVDKASRVATLSKTQLDASSTLPQPLALRRRMVRKWLFNNGVEAIGLEAVDTILGLMEAGEGTTVYELNGRRRVVVEYGQPRFEESAHTVAPEWSLTLEKGTGWRKDHGNGAGILPAEASFDAARTRNSPIEVRGWKPGDRIAPLGMEGSRKLQDIFTDQKIPTSKRSRIPVVVCGGEIIWLPGYRIARGWEVPGPAAEAVHARIE